MARPRSPSPPPTESIPHGAIARKAQRQQIIAGALRRPHSAPARHRHRPVTPRTRWLAAAAPAPSAAPPAAAEVSSPPPTAPIRPRAGSLFVAATTDEAEEEAPPDEDDDEDEAKKCVPLTPRQELLAAHGATLTDPPTSSGLAGRKPRYSPRWPALLGGDGERLKAPKAFHVDDFLKRHYVPPPASGLAVALHASSARIVDVFRQWDSDGSGTVSKKEFRKAVTSMGLTATPGEADALYDLFDPDKSGAIDYREMKKILRRGVTDADVVAAAAATTASAPSPMKREQSFRRARQHSGEIQDAPAAAAESPLKREQSFKKTQSFRRRRQHSGEISDAPAAASAVAPPPPPPPPMLRPGAARAHVLLTPEPPPPPRPKRALPSWEPSQPARLRPFESKETVAEYFELLMGCTGAAHPSPDPVFRVRAAIDKLPEAVRAQPAWMDGCTIGLSPRSPPPRPSTAKASPRREPATAVVPSWSSRPATARAR